MLSTTQIAEKLGVNLTTVRRWIYSGKLPAVRLGNHSWMVQEADLAAFKRPKRGRPKKTEIDK